jgi:hypothetical protein
VSRTYFIKLNLDAMCAELDTLRPDQHAEWMAGFRAGSRGKIPDGWDGPRLMGAQFGKSCFESAEAFRASASEAGKRSADVRRQAHGTAQPERKVEGRSKVVRSTFERDSERNTELTSNQYPVSNIPETSNQNTYGQTLPTRDGVGYRLPRSVGDQLVKAYPGADLDTELSKMAVWLAANPAKGKTARGMLRFINGWMGRVRGTPDVQVEQDDIPSESDWLACKEIAEACEAEKNSKTGTA